MIEFSGTVIHGKGVGSRIGFPTANLAISEAPHLHYGVYAATVLVDGQWHRAIVNIGKHPTLPEGLPSIEIHLIDATLDLYGKGVTVRLLRFLREERTFASVDALREQIRRDIASV